MQNMVITLNMKYIIRLFIIIFVSYAVFKIHFLLIIKNKIRKVHELESFIQEIRDKIKK